MIAARAFDPADRPAGQLRRAIGVIPIFFLRRLKQPVEDAMMGFGAGVMLAATAFELALPAVE